MNYIKFWQGEENLKAPVINYDNIKKGKITFEAYCEYKVSLLKNFFSELRDFLLNKFLNSINGGRTLIKYDEKIYDYYTMVINYYKSAIEAYDKRKNEIESDEIVKIADGIHDVLECQINKFEESFDNFESFSNPVKKEKEKIIDLNVKLFIQNLDLIYNDISQKNDLLDIDNYLLKIYNTYFSAVKNCFIQLNDINARKVTSYYYDSLKQEREALSVIIKIQADVLERKIQSMEDEVIIQSVLMKLREGYQHLSKQIDEMERDFKEAVVYDDFISKFDDEFKNDIIDCFKNSQRIAEAEKNHFDCCNSEFIADIGKNCSEVILIEKIESEIEEILFFSEKVISKFQFLYDFWKNKRDFYNDLEFSEIISGIAETVFIKIQNIKENVEEFSESALEIVSEIHNKNRVDELFILCSQASDENFENVMAEFSAVFADYDNKIKKIQKLILKLKKDSILFEISTFEEIMNYSVSRMRNSGNMEVEEFVQNMDFVFDELRQVLSVVGVEIIAPEPHDLFNGKEHEVMMAEKNDAFKKGEVIKLMNCGYKEGENIILRANIIAAK